MNLAIRGIEGDLGESNGDSFTDDKHKDLRADYILANPPYNSKDYWKAELEGDPRWIFGKPDEKNANYAWLELMYAKLAPKGLAAILMPNGATTSGGVDLNVRKAMVEAGKVDAILDLPDKLFANTGISVQCWVLNHGKTDTNILFVNASSMGRMISRKLRVLDPEDIDKVAKTYHAYKKNEDYKDVLGFCKKASIEEIKEKDFSLNPGRYVGVDDSNKMTPEEIQEELKKTSAELFKLIEEGKELEDKVKQILIEEMK